VVANARAAAAILRAACNAGELRFDVEPEEFLRDGAVIERKPDCNAP
jgi:hypothetical protein